MNDGAGDASDRQSLEGRHPRPLVGRTVWALYGLFAVLLFSGSYLLVRMAKGREPLFDSWRVDVWVGVTLVGLALVAGIVFRNIARRRGLMRAGR